MDDSDLLLMIPGPIQPEDSVLEAMGSPVRAHYGPGFTALYNQVLDMLKEIFNTRGDVFLMIGAGTCGIDACIGSAFSTGEKVIVGINGFFGQRLKTVAESNGLTVVPVEEAWGRPFTPSDFEAAARQHPDAKGICVVHLETSTTVINPLKEIGQIAYEHGLCFVVDTVSSLGGVPVRMDDWHVDLCASATQKCLGSPPGLAPVAVSPFAWQMIDRDPNKCHGWYTDLRVWRQYATDWASWHPFPITMATNNVLALNASLESLLIEGVESRMQRYRNLALRLRDGLRRIGMPPFTPDEILAPVITAAFGPEGVPTSRIVSYMADQHHVKIAGGLGQLENKIIRIGHMAPTVSEKEIDLVLDGLALFR